MLKILKKFALSIIYGAFLLYFYNLIGFQFGLIIPINIVTLGVTSTLKLPGLLALLALLVFVF